MRTTLLNVSRRRELTLHGEIAADVSAALETLAIRGLIIGAFARDLHLHYGAGIQMQRATQDIDFAIAVSNWDEFDALRQYMLNSNRFQAVPQILHRLRHRSAIPIDLVPFGNIESATRTIAWPPRGDVVMDAIGLQEAMDPAQEVLLPGETKMLVVSLPAFAVLKVFAWAGRNRRLPGKDAADLMLVVENYLRICGNNDRVFSEFIEWTQDKAFDYEHSAGRLLGYDMRKILSHHEIERINSILAPQIEEEIGSLILEMAPRSPGRARTLLQGLLTGILG